MRLRAPASIALGSIDADERDTRLRKRNRDASGPASELEDGTLLLQSERSREGHVAAAERACVLPVIERRVLLPASMAFAI